jgi:hypothetical protein
MNRYTQCSSCSRLVKAGDSACPFCGEATRSPSVSSSRRPLPRLSRAQWLARGSALAVVSCTGSGAMPSSTMDASVSREEASHSAPGDSAAGDSAPSDAAAAADRTDGDGGSSNGVVASPSFPCGTDVDASLQCERATQICLYYSGGPGFSCISQDGSTLHAYQGGTYASPDSAAVSCDACAGGAGCTFYYGPPGSCWPSSCSQDDAGGVTVSCGECYGAPPARLERLAPRQNHRGGAKRRRSTAMPIG